MGDYIRKQLKSELKQWVVDESVLDEHDDSDSVQQISSLRGTYQDLLFCNSLPKHPDYMSNR